MSGIGVVCHLDGRPAEPGMVNVLAQAIRHRGPDGLAQWHRGPVGLAHSLLWTTPESLKERAPVSDGQRWLVWDGRLDNRQELLSALHSEHVPCGADTDPELVLGAYRVWGARCAEHLLGEFAFVVWDEPHRTLFGARDRIGLKPFYYTQQGSTLFIASEAKALLRVLARMPEPDDEMLLAILLAECRDPDHGRSLFRGIHRLPPGHTMCVTDGGLRLARYWHIDPSAQTVYPQPEAYVEHFRALFEEAVKCRTRSAFPLGCSLSGGLDSSSITAVAAKHGTRVEAFTTYSTHAVSDERPFARQVCDAAGIPLWESAHTRRDPLEGLDELLWTVECPLVATEHSNPAFHALVRSRNCRIRLHGQGGDHVLDELGYLADLLRRASPWRFLRETRQFAQWYGAPVRDFLDIAVRGAMPGWLKAWGKRLRQGRATAWLNQELVRTVGLSQRLGQPRVPMRFPSLSQTLLYEVLFSPYFLVIREMEEREAARMHQEIWYPILDSRLVEFIFSIPWTQRCQQGVRKWLLREAMRGLLPEPVRLRQGKGDWTPDMDQSLLELCRRTPPEPLANRSGMMARFVDWRGAGALVRRYETGQRGVRWEVWSLIALDHWLTTFWKGGEMDGKGHSASQETVHTAEAALLR